MNKYSVLIWGHAKVTVHPDSTRATAQVQCIQLVAMIAVEFNVTHSWGSLGFEVDIFSWFQLPASPSTECLLLL